jgi:hypothetical protein
MRYSIYSILLVILLQLLWVAAESNGWESSGSWHRRALKVSAGFPVRCASYTLVHTTGDVPPNYPERSQWLPGLHLAPVMAVLDALAAVAAFFGFRWFLRFEAGRIVCVGFVLGLVAGVLDSLSTIQSWRPFSVWIVAPLLILGLPAIVCFLTRHSRSVWLPLLALAVAVLVMPWMAARLEYFRPDYGFSFAASFSITWSPSAEEMLFLPLAAIAVLSIPVLLMRWFIPLFRKYEAVA